MSAIKKGILISKAQDEGYVHIMKGSFAVFFILYGLAGGISPLEAVYFVGASLAPSNLSRISALPGLFFFRGAALAHILCELEPTWQLCYKVTNTMQRR